MRWLVELWQRRNAELVLGFLAASVIWLILLGWQVALTPNEPERRRCYEIAQKAGTRIDECKTFWERTIGEPVAFFTFGLAIATLLLGVSTVALWQAGEKQADLLRETSEIQSRDARATIAAAEAANRIAAE